MPPVILTSPVTRWACPSCSMTDVTREAAPHTRMHSCPGMGMLTVPMLRAGARGQHTMNDREDYVGSEQVRRTDAGRVVMSVTTEREDGSDCTVYAPTATARED